MTVILCNVYTVSRVLKFFWLMK